jgi:uncharacterized MAPEG superfamily protein
MTSETTILAWAMGLGLLHLLATVPLLIARHGIGYVFSARDEDRPLAGVGARLQRAFANFMQTFPFFAAAVLMAQTTGHHGGATLLGAQLYLYGRLLYIPVYLAGIPVLRTLCWLTSVGGILLVLAALL